ncbi:hypothetical protein K0M31_018334, partial [Melipona bicolor]
KPFEVGGSVWVLVGRRVEITGKQDGSEKVQPNSRSFPAQFHRESVYDPIADPYLDFFPDVTTEPVHFARRMSEVTVVAAVPR